MGIRYAYHHDYVYDFFMPDPERPDVIHGDYERAQEFCTLLRESGIDREALLYPTEQSGHEVYTDYWVHYTWVYECTDHEPARRAQLDRLKALAPRDEKGTPVGWSARKAVFSFHQRSLLDMLAEHMNESMDEYYITKREWALKKVHSGVLVGYLEKGHHIGLDGLVSELEESILD